LSQPPTTIQPFHKVAPGRGMKRMVQHGHCWPKEKTGYNKAARLKWEIALSQKPAGVRKRKSSAKSDASPRDPSHQKAAAPRDETHEQNPSNREPRRAAPWQKSRDFAKLPSKPPDVHCFPNPASAPKPESAKRWSARKNETDIYKTLSIPGPPKKLLTPLAAPDARRPPAEA